MTEQLEQVEIADGTPVKYVRRKYRGNRVRVPIRAQRSVCQVCGTEFWRWPKTAEEVCAVCWMKRAMGGEHD